MGGSSHLLQRFAMGSAVTYSCLLLSLFTLQALCQTPPPCCQTKTVTNAPAGNENLNGEYVLKEAAGDKPHENCADGCVYMKDDEEYCFMNVPMDQAAEIECDATSGGPDGGEGTSPQAGPTGTGAGETAGPGAPTAGPGTDGTGAPTGGPGAGTGASTGGPGAGTLASTGGPGAGTGASTGGPGAGTGAGASTAGAPAGTTAQGAGATTIGDPSARGQAAQEAKEKATQEKEEAETTVAAAQETSETAEEVGKKID